jgi:cold shock CspA family protein
MPIRTMMCSAPEDDLVFGTVKWFDAVKGFGFIIPDSGDRDVFVHQTQIHADGFRSLADGEKVRFRVEAGDDGRERAVGVTSEDGGFVAGAPRPNRNQNDWADAEKW